MTEDTIRVVKTETKIYEVDRSHMSDYVDDVEEWAENHALTNSPVAEEVDSEIDRLEVKGNKNGDTGE